MIVSYYNDMGIPFEGLAKTINIEEDKHIKLYENKRMSTTTVISTLEYCKLKQWYVYHTRMEVPLSSMFKPMLGDFMHSSLYSSNEMTGELIEREKNISLYPEIDLVIDDNKTGLKLFGTTDLITLTSPNAPLNIFDYKFTTTNSMYLPKLRDMLQVLIYKLMVEDKFGAKVGYPNLIYIVPFNKEVAGCRKGRINFRSVDFQRYVTVKGFDDLLKKYYDKVHPKILKSRYDGGLDHLPYLDVETDSVLKITSIKDYMRIAMQLTQNIIFSNEMDNDREDREGKFDKKNTWDKKWVCDYCEYSNICHNPMKNTDEKKNTTLLSSDNKEFADKHNVKYEKW